MYLTESIFWTGLGELAEDNCFVCRRRREVVEQRRRRTNMNDPLASLASSRPRPPRRTPDGLTAARNCQRLAREGANGVGGSITEMAEKKERKREKRRE